MEIMLSQKGILQAFYLFSAAFNGILNHWHAKK